MTPYQSVAACLRLLPARDRGRLGLIVLLQSATSVMDLAGVLTLGIVAALAVSSATGTEAPSSIKGIVESVGFSTDRPEGILALAAVAASMLLVKSVLSAYLNLRILRFLAVRQAMISTEVSRRLLACPEVALHYGSSQEIAFALTSSVTTATVTVLGQASVLVSETALILILGIGLLAVNPLVTLGTIGYFALAGVVLHRLVAGRAAVHGTRDKAAQIASISTIQDSLRLYREIFVADQTEWFANKFGEVRRESAAAQASIQFIGSLPKYLFEIVLVLGACLLALSQFFANSAEAAVATIAIFTAAGSRIAPSILRLQTAVTNIKTGTSQAEPLFSLLDQLNAAAQQDVFGESKTDIRNTCKPTAAHSGSTEAIELDGVCVRYPGASRLSLDTVNLRILRGERVAIVGPSGAGKSTLADTLLGLALPQSGRVSIWGYPPRSGMASRASYATQGGGAVNGSIRDNIVLGLDPRIVDDAQIWSILDQTRLTETVHGLGDGLDSLVGEGGSRLSGGELQRLGLARALFAGPDLLVLDEATSALDAETEAAISNAIDTLGREVTVVAIAHRLASVRYFDRFAYVEDGKLVAVGTFEQLRTVSVNFNNQAALNGF